MINSPVSRLRTRTLRAAITLLTGGALLAASGLFAARPSQALSIVYVNSTSDDQTSGGVCTTAPNVCLRNAIQTANTSGTPTVIYFASAVLGKTITFNGSGVFVSDAGGLTIDGAPGIVTIAGNSTNAILAVASGDTLTLNNLFITGGGQGGVYVLGTLNGTNDSFDSSTTATASEGGGITNTGTLNLTRSNIWFNKSDTGGGLYNSGTATLNSVYLFQNSGLNATTFNNGGGIYNYNGVLTLNNSFVSGNTAADGAGIDNFGGNVTITDTNIVKNGVPGGVSGNTYAAVVNFAATAAMSITSSTIADNTASPTSDGGGLWNNSTITLNSDTITANSAQFGGGLYVSGTTTTNILNTIVAGNTLIGSGGGSPDVAGIVSSLGSNFIGDGTGSSGYITSGANADRVGTGSTPLNPQLAALAYNGGLGESAMPLPGSPVIGTGNCTITTDQRGVSRKTPRCDVGAFESFVFAPNPVPSVNVNSAFSVNLIASGGTGGYSYTLASGSTLPTGVSLSTAGTLYGTVSRGGLYSFNVQAEDGLSDLDLGGYALTVIGPKDTIGVFRPSTGNFFLRKSNTTGYADYTLNFGNSNSFPVAGDWNGDGIDTIGYVDSTTGVFQLTNGTLPNPSVDYSLVFGNPGDHPFSGHWSTSATSDGLGVFRTSNGILYVKLALTTGAADYSMVLGNPGDLPVSGDWTQKGYDSVGIYRPGASKFYLSNVLTNGIINGDVVVPFGTGTGIPIAGDWTGVGAASLALDNNGVFTTKNYPYTGSTPDNTFTFGAAGDLPVAGVWGVNNGNVVHPAHTTPPTIIVPKTATPIAPNNGNSGSVPGGNQIGG